MISRFKQIRRKVFGLIFGVFFGLSVSVVTSKKSYAFGGFGLSDEELFEMFLEYVGTILMRFFSNRFISNLDKTLDQLSERIDDDNKSSKAELAKAIGSASDAEITALRELANMELRRECFVPANACVQHEIAAANHEIYKVSGEFNNALNKRNQTYLLDQSTSSGKQQLNRNYFLKSLMDGDTANMKQLHLLLQPSSFTDPQRAEKEIAALVANIQTSIRDREGARANSVNVQLAGNAVMADTIVNGLNYLLSQRLKSSVIPQGILDSFSSELRVQYKYKKISSVEMLEAEVNSASENSKFYDTISQLPSATSAMVMMNQLTSTSNKLHHELLKTEEHISNLMAIQAIIKESRANG